ncbi:MAG: HtaA domain-containing protein [Candidatus Nanopelagicales bacterium]|jgi:hypothetical protein
MTDEQGPPEFGLTWPIKRSFVTYVLGMPDGRAGAVEGAFPLPDLSVVFEHDPSVDAAALGDGWAFRGDVRFAGHFGMLFVRIADPWLVRTDDGVLLTIADPDAQDDGPRVPLATVTVEQTGAGEWASTAVALTAQGSELFNSVYPVGDPLDPFTLRVPVGA